MDESVPLVQVRDHPERGAYEATVAGEVVGIVGYNDVHNRRVLTHTSIDPEYRHRGIAHEVIRYALEDIRARHLTVTIICPVVTAFIQEHPEYADLIDPARPGRAPL